MTEPESAPPLTRCAECGEPMKRIPLLIGWGMQCTRCTHWYPLPDLAAP